MKLGERTFSFATARSKRSHLKYARFFPSKSLDCDKEFENFLRHCLGSRKSRGYCCKIVETLSHTFETSKERERYCKTALVNAFNTAARARRGLIFDSNGIQVSDEVVAAKPKPRLPFDPLKVMKVYEFCSERLTNLVDFMVYGCRHTGCRPIELLKLGEANWADLADTGACPFDSKTGRVSFIMSPNVARLIGPRILEHTVGLDDAGCARLYCRALRELNQIWLKVNGQRKTHGDGFKMFRCLVAFEGISRGDNVYGLRQLLRHSTVNMTEHYAHRFGVSAAKDFVEKYYPGHDPRTGRIGTFSSHSETTHQAGVSHGEFKAL